MVTRWNLLDMFTEETVRVTTREGHDFCPAWSPDGTRLAMASLAGNGERYIRITYLDGTEVARLATGFARVTQPAWSPDGRAIVFAARTQDGDYDLYRVEVPE